MIPYNPTYNTTALSDGISFSNIPYIASFRLKGPSPLRIAPVITNFPTSFQLNITYLTSPIMSSSTIQILFYNSNILQSFNRFNVTFVSGTSYSTNFSTVSYQAASSTPSYSIGENLIFGTTYIYTTGN